MDHEIQYEVERKLDALDQKIDAIYTSVEKTRNYFFWTMVITVVIVVVPAIGLVFAIPAFLNNSIGAMQGI